MVTKKATNVESKPFGTAVEVAKCKRFLSVPSIRKICLAVKRTDAHIKLLWLDFGSNYIGC